MKIQHLLTEAIENPKGPARIPTGAGKTALDNPAHSERGYYEGDPDQFNFGAQTRNYQALKAALARSGKQFNYLAVAGSPLGRDTFIATAPGILWYKYESSNPASGQNILYVNGVKTKTTEFIAKAPEQQAAMLVADPAHIKLEKRDVFGYLSALAKSERTAAQILAEITPRKDFIVGLVTYQLRNFPKESTKLRTINKLLAKKSALPQWLAFDTVRQIIQPSIAKDIIDNISLIARYASDRLQDYKNAELITTYDYIHTAIDQKFNSIFDTVKKQIIMAHPESIDALFKFLKDVDYKTDRIDINAMSRSIPVSSLERMINPGVSNQTGNMTKSIRDWLQLGIPKENIVAAFNEQKDQLIGHSILELARVGKATFADNTMNSIKTLGLEWPEFASENIVKLINDKKDQVIRTMLTTMKAYSDSEYQLLTVRKTVDFLKSVDVKWPELAAIEKSLNSMLASKQLEETAKPKGRTMKISEVTELEEDLGNLAQLNLGPMINLLKQSYSRGGNRSTPHIGHNQRRFAYTEIGSKSKVLDIGTIKKDTMKTIRAFYKKSNENIQGFALYIGGTPVLFALADDYTLAGGSRVSRVAYDLTPFEQEFRAHIDATYDRWSSKPGVKTGREREERNYGHPDDRWDNPITVTQRYTGDVTATGDLSKMVANIEAVANAVGQPLTAKAVTGDTESMGQRNQRYQNKPAPRIRDAYEMKRDLDVRLKRFKNAKRPSAATIEEFIAFTLNGAAKVVNFAGHPYQMISTSYDKIEPQGLLSGKPFKASYRSNDPEAYQTVEITYMFDRATNMLNPIKAEWKESADAKGYGGKSQMAVLDVKGYLRSELKIPRLDKERVIPALLSMYKSSPGETTFTRILSIIKALRKAGEDWPELTAIEKSIQASSKAENR
jgi:hypothetical protein